MGEQQHRDTRGADYAERLAALEGVWWKRLLNVQAPYRWNLRRLGLGRTLDVGCGLGRNLAHLGPDSVGVDHNPDSVGMARARGLTAYTSKELQTAPGCEPASFDSALLAHVVEHMDSGAAEELLRIYLPYVRPGGTVVLITPQEKGYTTDDTHVRFVDFDGSRALAEAVGLEVRRSYSFPLPRAAGKVFPYNEFVVVATKP